MNRTRFQEDWKKIDVAGRRRLTVMAALTVLLMISLSLYRDVHQEAQEKQAAWYELERVHSCYVIRTDRTCALTRKNADLYCRDWTGGIIVEGVFVPCPKESDRQ